MNPLTLNDSLVPDYGIAVAAQYKFYVAWTWWDDGTITLQEKATGKIGTFPARPTRQRFGGATLTSSCPLLNVLQVQKALEQQEGHPVVILFWSEQDL